MNNKTRKILVLVIALMAYFLTALDSSLVLTSLTKIQADLHLDQVALSWIQDAYGLAFGSFILVSGKLGDILGRKKMMIAALTLFLVSSLTTAVSTAAIFTIFSRFVQGMGAAILAPTSLALLIDYFKGAELNKAVAWYSSVAGIGMSVGLILGGSLATFFTWRAGFYLNALVSLLLLILSFVVLDNRKGTRNQHLDMAGALFSILGTGLIVYAVNGARNIWPYFLSGLLLMTIFVVAEKRVKNPLMPLALFNNTKRWLAYLSRAFLVAAAMGYYFYDSEYQQAYLHFSSLTTGLAYLPMTLTLFVTAIWVSSLINDIKAEKLLLVGAVLILLAFVWAVLAKNNNYLIGILGPEILLGAGQGLALAPQTSLGIYQVKLANSGAASGTLNMFHQIGGVLGIALMTQYGISILKVHTISLQYNGAMVMGLVMAIGLMITALLEMKSN